MLEWLAPFAALTPRDAFPLPSILFWWVWCSLMEGRLLNCWHGWDSWKSQGRLLLEDTHDRITWVQNGVSLSPCQVQENVCTLVRHTVKTTRHCPTSWLLPHRHSLTFHTGYHSPPCLHYDFLLWCGHQPAVSSSLWLRRSKGEDVANYIRKEGYLQM